MGYIEGLLGDNEKIVVRTRQHWVALASGFLGNLITAAAIIFVTILATAVATPILGPLAPFVLALLLLLVFPFFGFFRDFLDWWNEEYLVTNRRVVQSEGTINKHVIDSSLEKVNDVVLRQSLLGRLLNYGDIEIMTASEFGVNRLQRIAGPVKFKTVMLNQKEAMGSDEGLGARPVVQQDVPDLIAELDDLRKKGVLTDAEFQQKKAELLAKM
ncbi:MAG: PH domain-containing protein [Chloroflexi bacterium]|nr:PH domain-containing protein [Chloroflexota bacterium]